MDNIGWFISGLFAGGLIVYAGMFIYMMYFLKDR